MKWYKENYSILYATLKDELRKVGKHARLFRIMDAAAYAEALCLFHNQNQYMQSNVGEHPMFVQFTHPGTHIASMFASLLKHNGVFNDADGNGWDAHLNLLLVEMICRWRCRYHSEPERVIEYYQRMYNGYTVGGGYIMQLTGQPSGHLLTTTDNSLCNIGMMALNAYRNDMSVPDFLEKVLFYCCGDDLVWSDRSGLFDPKHLDETYHSLGMYLEFGDQDGKEFFDLQFVSTKPVMKVLRGSLQLTYTNDPERLWPKVQHSRKSATALETVSRMSSYCSLLFNSSYYSAVHEMMTEFVYRSIKEGKLPIVSREVAGLMLAASPAALEAAYTCNEAGYFSPVSVGLST